MLSEGGEDSSCKINDRIKIQQINLPSLKLYSPGHNTLTGSLCYIWVTVSSLQRWIGSGELCWRFKSSRDTSLSSIFLGNTKTLLESPFLTSLRTQQTGDTVTEGNVSLFVSYYVNVMWTTCFFGASAGSTLQDKTSNKRTSLALNDHVRKKVIVMRWIIEPFVFLNMPFQITQREKKKNAADNTPSTVWYLRADATNVNHSCGNCSCAKCKPMKLVKLPFSSSLKLTQTVLELPNVFQNSFNELIWEVAAGLVNDRKHVGRPELGDWADKALNEAVITSAVSHFRQAL